MTSYLCTAKTVEHSDTFCIMPRPNDFKPDLPIERRIQEQGE